MSRSDAPQPNAFFMFVITVAATAVIFWAGARVLATAGAFDWDLEWRQAFGLSALYVIHRLFWHTLTSTQKYTTQK